MTKLGLRSLVAGFLLAGVSLPATAWFFIIPGGLISGIADKMTGAEGEHCVAASARLGDRIRVGDTQWVVKSLSGTSSRCNAPQFPIRARLEPYLTEEELRAEIGACVSDGKRVGEQVLVPGVGDVLIRSISTVADCSDAKTPLRVRAVRLGGIQPTSQAEQPPTTIASTLEPQRSTSVVLPSNMTCVPFGTGPGDKMNVSGREVEIVRILRNEPHCESQAGTPLIAVYKVVTATGPAPTTVLDPTARPVADRLRELKQLRDENLITQEIYEARQREILSGR
jgi:hypothetical protein